MFSRTPSSVRLVEIQRALLNNPLKKVVQDEVRVYDNIMDDASMNICYELVTFRSQMSASYLD
jgi:hypothetical protein